MATHDDHRIAMAAAVAGLAAEGGGVHLDDAAAADDNIWVVAITGSGDAFCAGLDLTPGPRWTKLSPMTAQLDDIGWVGNFMLAIRKRCDKPVVAGINGVAVGAGLGLAMATDVRIVARSARLMAGYTRIGGSPDAGLSITLPEAMGYERAMRFMLENREEPRQQDPSPSAQDLVMAVAIRLRRTGRTKAPTYRIVVADSRSPRDGKFIEILGQYQPRSGEKALNLNAERANYWMDNGAQPSDTVRSLLRKAGVLKARHEARLAAKLSAAAVPVKDA